MSGASREGAGAGAVLMAFLAGALVGAVGALLLAPRSGVETQQRLAEAAGQAGDRARRARAAARAAAAAAASAFEEAMHGSKPPAAG
jgi:gas vesicle protein